MKTSMLLASTIVAAGLLFAVPASAAVSVQVTPTLAPNAFGSPSYAAWVQNSVNAQLVGAPSGGAAGPTQYNAQSSVTAQESIVTGFPSWKGQADPGTVFGGAYANELGNRMAFGVLITSSGGTQFSASQISFTGVSDDPGNVLGFTFGTGSYNYSLDYQGILYGTNGVLGGGDDTFVTTGVNTQMVDALVGRGSGNSLAAYCPGCSIADQQLAINAAASTFTDTTHFTGTYTVGNLGSGSGTFTIGGAVPEPATWAMMLTGFGGLGAVMRRRRAISRTAFA